MHDRGLQQERTYLAWDRTGLALIAASGLLVRMAGQPLLQVANLLSGVGFLLGSAIVVFDRVRYLSRWRQLQLASGMLASGWVVMVALTSVFLGITALIVVFA